MSQKQPFIVDSYSSTVVLRRSHLDQRLVDASDLIPAHINGNKFDNLTLSHNSILQSSCYQN